ncbi:hypothetical protein Blue_046 [Bacillus phage Deep Blue]|uniref:Uncharacterized protein n=1 Tax=Bacillus phage Deep Blue TaxID=1792245 RepID=A0A140HLK7_9CAUD|nr:hypothetical protein Blue_046 [Bacillus phage Deep Blue]AMO25869.1 hypothetical protein Blue_046 [Bacillus phage Deep Blue]
MTALYVRMIDVKLLLKDLKHPDSTIDHAMDVLYEKAKFANVDDGSDPKEHFYVAKSMTRKDKIELCYEVAKITGEEVEQPFEDMLEHNLEKSFLYCFKIYWEKHHKEEKEWLL